MAKTTDMKRFTITLDRADYDALRRIAETQRPPLSLQYVVRYALQRFLDEYEDCQLMLTLTEKRRTTK